MSAKRTQRSYDHRLLRLVRDTGDTTIATRIGVPRSTVAGWLRRPLPAVTTAPRLDEPVAALHARIAKLEARVARLAGALRVLLALLRTVSPDLARVRIAGDDKHRLLRAVERSRGVRGVHRLLVVVGLSPARLRAWRSAARECELQDQSSSPHDSPQGLTMEERRAIRDMVTSPAYQLVPTGRLAMLVQRLGRVFASASTWRRLVRLHGWRRPRLRVHPAKPRVGIRATKPDEIWHIDATVIRLLDGSRVYLHAVIDNFSRRILSWCLNRTFDAGCSADLLMKAGAHLERDAESPTLLADGGVENYNKHVDAVVDSDLLKRVLAQMEISFSNSLIEAWWRALKHQWLFLNGLDTEAKVRGLVEFYVAEHNGRIPHSAFKGQTPDEMYFGKGDEIPERLETARQEARAARLGANRARRCGACG
jgi:putative transposase